MDTILRFEPARQNLRLVQPAKGQLHWLSSQSVPPGIFVLILNVDGNRCDVLPGSMDALEAGSDDVVLPPQIFGDYVMISAGPSVSLPRSALGIGFAALGESVFRRICDAVSRHAKGEAALGLVRGYPYVSEFDERIAYHKSMSDALSRLQYMYLDESAATNASKTEKLREALAWVLAHRKPFVQEPIFEFVPAMAAAPVSKAVSADCRVEGFDGVVNVRYVPSEKKLHLRVFGPDDNRSEALSGWTVLGTGETPLGEISGADFCHEFATEFDGVVALMDKQGKVYLLQEVEGDAD